LIFRHGIFSFGLKNTTLRQNRLLDYAIPKAGTLPPVTLATMETLSPTNPLGVKGIGELPTVAAPVAVTNAIMDALSSVGVRHIDTPLTAEKIWRALHGGGER
jgi:aerobic carbon-monoxide dehydrogenase large subunit